MTYIPYRHTIAHLGSALKPMLPRASDEVTGLRSRVVALEHELEDMTAALTQAWDQLVPFLQEAPPQANSTEDIAPIIHAVMAAADVEAGGFYLFQDDEWYGVPDQIALSTELRQALKELSAAGKTFRCRIDCNENGAELEWLFAPVMIHGAVVAAIGIGSHDARRMFSAADDRILVRMAERAGSQLAAAQLAKSRERETLAQRELQIASMIQRSTQPLTSPKMPYLEVASFWEPARQVGGDAWGWVLQSDGSFAWFLLDVAGKGLPAALAAMSLHTALHLGLRLGFKPADLLNIINQEFYDSYTQTDLLATAAVMSFDPTTRMYEQANAGHPPLFVRMRGAWGTLEATAPPIGVLPDLGVRTQCLTLQPGDMIFCYSDGFTEIETPEGWWGETGLLDAVMMGGESACSIADTTVTAARNANGTHEIRDDQTLVVVTLK